MHTGKKDKPTSCENKCHVSSVMCQVTMSNHQSPITVFNTNDTTLEVECQEESRIKRGNHPNFQTSDLRGITPCRSLAGCSADLQGFKNLAGHPVCLQRPPLLDHWLAVDEPLSL